MPQILNAQDQPSGQVEQAWAARYDSGGYDVVGHHSLATDNSGNVYVAGYARDLLLNNYGFVLLKYDRDGNQLWVTRYDNGPYNVPIGISVDSSGDIYVTSQSLNGQNNYDYVTAKYDPNGNQVWMARYDTGGNDWPTAIAIDSFDNVYVTGESGDRSSGYTTIKYNSSGEQLWVVRSGYGDYTPLLAVDSAGNVYVSGNSWHNANQDYTTIKYDTDGNQLWKVGYDNGGSDYPTDISIDNSGNVYITGTSENGIDQDYATIKYDVDGNQLWARRYDSIGNDAATALAVDTGGNVYVSGQSKGSTTLKYSSDGTQLWAARYNYLAYIDELAVDDSRNVYVAGSTGSYDFAVVKYNSNGDQLWVAQYDSGGIDIARSIAVDNTNNIYVAGYGCDPYWQNCDYLTIKYIQSLDETSPEIKIILPADNSVIQDMKFEIEFDVTDPLVNGYASGIASVAALLDDQSMENGQVVNATQLKGGEHIFSVQATDNAGNQATQEARFVLASPRYLKQESLDQLKNIQTNQKWTQKQLDQAAEYLTKSLDPNLWLDDWRVKAFFDRKVDPKLEVGNLKEQDLDDLFNDSTLEKEDFGIQHKLHLSSPNPA